MLDAVHALKTYKISIGFRIMTSGMRRRNVRLNQTDVILNQSVFYWWKASNQRAVCVQHDSHGYSAPDPGLIS